ncbi:SDR family NAD(P)-dependent oxidoreductase [Pedosphaera parvula]|uniref:Short-chain dehydrogenase/reductase SDR n=1 Tax=Pedosphaera parvula (strain Ellin514) TaxID=320771 RepID=B9XH91_PEDPL|nr:SDR family oxidoreductase [Pedosphaera parvula]EEF60726.1 short-chain dehydrogenase/reductase SDR [Pedosphaera parvula Ellin514]
MKQWALITGASQGIGYEFTMLFAANGYNLILVARDQKRLEEVADEVSSKYKVTVKVIPKDLSQPAAALDIFNEIKGDGLEVEVLINNAGFGLQGPFTEIELSKHLALIQVNITALVELTHLLARPMVKRGSGRILNVASTAAFQPGPFMAMYYASKAFVYSFSCALARELKGTGVTVTTLNPGITRSQFHSRAHLKRDVGMVMMEADQVARIGYDALMHGKPNITAGFINKLSSSVSKALPTRFTTNIAARLNRQNGG